MLSTPDSWTKKEGTSSSEINKTISRVYIVLTRGTK